MPTQRTQPEPQTNLSAMWARHWSVPAIICTVLTVIVALSYGYRIILYIYIRVNYGEEAWRQGLHVINKRGDLSNGDWMGAWGALFVTLPQILLMLAAFFVPALSIAYLKMRRRGERFCDQLVRYRQGD